MSSAHPIFYPKLSAMMIGYISIIHIFSMSCVIGMMTGGWLYLIVFLLFLSSIFYTCYIAGFCQKQRISAMEFIDHHHWKIHLMDGVVKNARLSGRSILTLWIMILHFNEVGSKEKWVICLFSDGLSRDERRMLRRCMKLGAMRSLF